MRKLLMVLFLLLITSFSVVGFVTASQADNNIIEQQQPSADHMEVKQ
ncbi:hypothetical protein GH741_15695 [Aquibacillus halophilus]|uniref:Uncharacterized protein n=1 Tax=Aquibacillus halophilus TaxID=930132 RepID=A0A6A8DHV2_9BACI|nr:hypothetical protein [Aquibacillus halophilus]MRH44086.1 hypothetical protein [Aquibacillus halophilus]